MPVPDPATVTIAVATVLTWLLGLSYQLGRYTARQQNLEKAGDSMVETIKAIFAKLDRLAEALPHKCDQVQTLFEMRGDIAAGKEKINNLEAWRRHIEKVEEP